MVMPNVEVPPAELARRVRDAAVQAGLDPDPIMAMARSRAAHFVAETGWQDPEAAEETAAAYAGILLTREAECALGRRVDRREVGTALRGFGDYADRPLRIRGAWAAVVRDVHAAVQTQIADPPARSPGRNSTRGQKP